MKRSRKEREVIVVFLGEEFTISTNNEGSTISKATVTEMLGDVPFVLPRKTDFLLLDCVTSMGCNLKEVEGEINVEGVDICWSKDWWKDAKESLLDLLEQRIRDVMSKKKQKRQDKLHHRNGHGLLDSQHKQLELVVIMKKLLTLLERELAQLP